jgi:hypothetical protein
MSHFWWDSCIFTTSRERKFCHTPAPLKLCHIHVAEAFSPPVRSSFPVPTSRSSSCATFRLKKLFRTRERHLCGTMAGKALPHVLTLLAGVLNFPQCTILALHKGYSKLYSAPVSNKNNIELNILNYSEQCCERYFTPKLAYSLPRFVCFKSYK